MEKNEMAEKLGDLVYAIKEGANNDTIAEMAEALGVRDIQTFQEAGLVTSDEGFIITARDRRKFRVIIING